MSILPTPIQCNIYYNVYNSVFLTEELSEVTVVSNATYTDLSNQIYLVMPNAVSNVLSESAYASNTAAAIDTSINTTYDAVSNQAFVALEDDVFQIYAELYNLSNMAISLASGSIATSNATTVLSNDLTVVKARSIETSNVSYVMSNFAYTKIHAQSNVLNAASNQAYIALPILIAGLSNRLYADSNVLYSVADRYDAVSNQAFYQLDLEVSTVSNDFYPTSNTVSLKIVDFSNDVYNNVVNKLVTSNQYVETIDDCNIRLHIWNCNAPYMKVEYSNFYIGGFETYQEVNGVEFLIANQTQLRMNRNGTTETFRGDLIINDGTVITDGVDISSDARLKTNVTPISDATAILRQLQPVLYDKVTHSGLETRKEAGLIAQNVWYDSPAIRHIVHLPRDADSNRLYTESNPTDIQAWGTDYAKVDYLSLIAYMIKAIQELDQRVTNKYPS